MEAGGGAKQGGEAQTAACAVCDHLTPQHAGGRRSALYRFTDLRLSNPNNSEPTMVPASLWLFGGGSGARRPKWGNVAGVTTTLSWTCVCGHAPQQAPTAYSKRHTQSVEVWTPYFCDPPKHASRLPLTPTVLEISTRPRCGPVVDFCMGKEVLCCSKLTVTDTPSRRSAANMNHFPVVRSNVAAW